MRRTPRQARWMMAAAIVAAAALTIPPATSLGMVPAAQPSATMKASFDIDGIMVRAKDLVQTTGFTCNAADPIPELLEQTGVVSYTEDPTAGTWQTWFVDPGQVTVPAPPAVASPETALELLELHQIALNRTTNQTLKAQFWDEGAAVNAWTSLYLELIVRHSSKDGSKNPPRLSRQIAILEMAMYDALVVTYAAKYCYKRPAPSMLDPALLPIVEVRSLPSYPSEHAAVAGAAAAILPIFFPCPDPEHCEEPIGTFDNYSREAAESRLWAGVNYRSDIEAGLAIGKAVGEAVYNARLNDGWNARWDGSGRITGPCNWVDTRPVPGNPVEPMWGKVTPFLMTSGSQFRPGPPPACDGPDYLAQTRDIYEVSKGLPSNPRQVEVARYWAAGQGTETPPGMNLHIALNASIDRDLTTMRAARVYAYMGAVEADAAIASWDAKFTYWSDRPVNGIRRLGFDPTWKSNITTPPFPGYISGHSTFSSAGATILSHFFPEDAVQFRALATEAANSRFYGGIHIRADNEVGLLVGQKIGQLAALRAQGDGAPDE